MKSIRLAAVKTIQLYQRTLSPDTGIFSGLFPYGFCRFHPTCSEYTCQTIIKHGLMRGVLRGIWRIMRCNPWNTGGFDPVK